MQVHVFDAETFDLGRVRVEVAPGETVAIYDEVRSVVDAVRLRHELGADIAYGAVKALVGRRRAAVRELVEVATTLRCAKQVRVVLEVVPA